MTMSVTFSDGILWGKLVKSWATGKNYIDATAHVFSVPRDLKDLLDQCQSIGLTVTISRKFPNDHLGIAILQNSREVVGIRLPPRDLVLETEAALGQNEAAYPLPGFYEQFFGRPLPALSKDDQLQFHAARIGDYSIQHCG